MDTGFITLHRKIVENPIWNNSQLSHLFLTLLLWANHEEKKILFNGKIELVGRGQLITGRYTLEEATGIPAGSIPRYLRILQELEIVNIKSNNKFSLITIVKYSDYQDKNGRENIKANNKRTSSEQQANTNNNDNNVNNDNKYNSADKPRGGKFDIGTYPREQYVLITDKYQSIKNIKLSGDEYLPVLREIKIMFKSGRTVDQIIETMEVCNSNYDDWSMNTVRMKIADVVGGKLFAKKKPGVKEPLIIKSKIDI